MTREYTDLHVIRIEKETEKAYQLTVTVAYNDNWTERTMWFPKSVIKIPEQENQCWGVKSWFADKASKEHAFKGYLMMFEL